MSIQPCFTFFVNFELSQIRRSSNYWTGNWETENGKFAIIRNRNPRTTCFPGHSPPLVQVQRWPRPRVGPGPDSVQYLSRIGELFGSVRGNLIRNILWSLIEANDKVTRVQYPENNGNRPGANPEHKKWSDPRYFPRGLEFEQDFVSFYRRNQGEDFRKGAFQCYQGPEPTRPRTISYSLYGKLSFSKLIGTNFWFT